MTEIITKYSDTVFKLAFVYVKNRSTAEDISQNVFIKYMESADKCFESDEHLKAWLLRVTINECKKNFRSLWTRKTDLYSTDELSMLVNTPVQTECYEPLLEALMKLPKKYNLVIHLYYYEELSIKEISSMLHRKENTVMSDIHRARGLIKEYLEDRNYDR